MSVFRKLSKQVVQRVSSLVARHELFERQGERPVQPPLSPGAWSSGSEPSTDSASDDEGDPDDEHRSIAADPDALREALRRGPFVVNHWATWCESCIAELPAIRDLAERAPWPMVGVSWDSFEDGDIVRSLREVDEVAAAERLRWRQYVVDGHPDDFFGEFAIEEQQIPQTWLVDSDGTITHRIHGVIDGAEVDAILKQMKTDA